MKKRFTEQQIVSILREIDVGAWRTKYQGMEASDVVKMGQVVDENTRLMRVVVNLSFENDAIKAQVAAASRQAEQRIAVWKTPASSSWFKPRWNCVSR